MSITSSEYVVPYLGGDESLQMYLDYIGQFDLLRAEEEVELAQRMEAGTYAQILLGLQQDTDTTSEVVLRSLGKSRGMSSEGRSLALAQMVEHPMFAAPEELTVLANDGSRARQTMVEANLRLPVSFAKRYIRSEQPLQDMISNGNIGLARAVDKFDYRQGYKFSTYAAFWIKKYIMQGLKDVQTGEDGRAVLLEDFELAEKPDKGDTIATHQLIIEPLWPGRGPGMPAMSNHPELLHLLNQVPEDTREILMMRLVDQLTVADISNRTGFSAGKINNIVRTTTARLRAATD